MKNKILVIIAVCIVLVIGVVCTAKPTHFVHQPTTYFKVKSRQTPSYNFKKEEVSSLLRLPKGIADYDRLVGFSLKNNIIEDIPTKEEVVQAISVKKFCDVLYSFVVNYRPLKDGFTDKVCPEDALAALDTLSKNEPISVSYCLEHGYITKEQAAHLEDTITTNIASRTIYRIAFNTIYMRDFEEEYMNSVLQDYLDVSSAPPCRKAKFTFLLESGMMPLNNRGELVLDHDMTLLDELAMLINLEDQLDFLAADSDNPNKGCQPCQYQSLVEARGEDTHEMD